MKLSASQIILAVVAVIVLGVVGIFLFSLGGDSSSEDRDSTSDQSTSADSEASNIDSEITTTQNEDTVTNETNTASDQPGVFTEYSSELLSDDKTNVIFFAAAWCTTCQALERDIEANLEDIPTEVQILKADFDTESELKQKYEVRVQHTLVEVDSNGELIQKWTGGNTLDTILERV